MKNTVIFVEYDDHAFIFVNGNLIMGGDWDNGCADTSTMESAAINMSTALTDCMYEHLDIASLVPENGWTVDDVEEVVQSTMFAVQYRHMHDGVHRMAVFDTAQDAFAFDRIIRETESLDSDVETPAPSDETMIDYRDVPNMYNGCPVVFVSNATGIPIVY